MPLLSGLLRQWGWFRALAAPPPSRAVRSARHAAVSRIARGEEVTVRPVHIPAGEHREQRVHAVIAGANGGRDGGQTVGLIARGLDALFVHGAEAAEQLNRVGPDARPIEPHRHRLARAVELRHVLPEEA